MQYTPNPGGGISRQRPHRPSRTRRGRVAPPEKGEPVRSKDVSCQMCVETGLPTTDKLCPFHQLETRGCVNWTSLCLLYICLCCVVSLVSLPFVKVIFYIFLLSSLRSIFT